jgi:hypothetical protein
VTRSPVLQRESSDDRAADAVSPVTCGWHALH